PARLASSSSGGGLVPPINLARAILPCGLIVQRVSASSKERLPQELCVCRRNYGSWVQRSGFSRRCTNSRRGDETFHGRHRLTGQKAECPDCPGEDRGLVRAQKT